MSFILETWRRSFYLYRFEGHLRLSWVHWLLLNTVKHIRTRFNLLWWTVICFRERRIAFRFFLVCWWEFCTWIGILQHKFRALCLLFLFYFVTLLAIECFDLVGRGWLLCTILYTSNIDRSSQQLSKQVYNVDLKYVSWVLCYFFSPLLYREEKQNLWDRPQVTGSHSYYSSWYNSADGYAYGSWGMISQSNACDMLVNSWNSMFHCLVLVSHLKICWNAEIVTLKS